MKLSEHETIARRTNPVAGHGMITTPHHLASQSGLAVLRRGGTAVDAAIAAGAVLSVVYPQMCGLGGDAFWLVHDTARGESRALNASGRAGRAVSRDKFAAPGGIAEVIENLLLKIVDNPVNAVAQGNYIGILAWVCIGLGVAVVLLVLLSNRRGPRGGGGRKRYQRSKTPRRKKGKLLSDRYYRDSFRGKYR